MAENMEIMDAMDIDTKEQQFDEDIENIIELLEEKSYFKARDEILKHNEVDIGEILEEVLEELGIEKTIILFRRNKYGSDLCYRTPKSGYRFHCCCHCLCSSA